MSLELEAPSLLPPEKRAIVRLFRHRRRSSAGSLAAEVRGAEKLGVPVNRVTSRLAREAADGSWAEFEVSLLTLRG